MSVAEGKDRSEKNDWTPSSSSGSEPIGATARRMAELYDGIVITVAVSMRSYN